MSPQAASPVAWPAFTSAGSLGVAWRHDPYWEAAWPAAVGGSTVSWGGPGWERRVAAAGSPDAVGRLARAEDTKIDRCLSPRAREVTLTILATLSAWHTMTDEQLAASTGFPALCGRRKGQLGSLSDAGLVQLGRLYRLDGRPAPVTMLRLDPGGRIERVEGQLSWAEWVRVTGARPWVRSLPSDRHDILAAELSLRAAECAPLAATLGEGFARLADLFGESRRVGKRRADAIWVRGDGLTIAVEMISSAPRSLAGKLSLWSDLLASPEGRGTAALFVSAVSPTDRNRHSAERATRQMIDEAAHGSPEAISAGVSGRMAYVTWEELFPAPGRMVRDFPALPARVPSGPPGPARWQHVEMLDPFAVPAPPGRSAPPRDLTALAGIPHWQRRPDAVDLDAEACRLAGLGDIYRRRLGVRPSDEVA